MNYLIKQNNAYLSYVKYGEPLYIGFSKYSHAVKVNKSIKVDPIITLLHNKREDISEDVRCGLQTYKMGHLAPSLIIVDTCAKLTILKDVNNYNIYNEIDIINDDEFMRYPFEKNIGIIMPIDLLYEDNTRFVFVSQVIEAAKIKNL